MKYAKDLKVGDQVWSEKGVSYEFSEDYGYFVANEPEERIVTEVHESTFLSKIIGGGRAYTCLRFAYSTKEDAVNHLISELNEASTELIESIQIQYSYAIGKLTRMINED